MQVKKWQEMTLKEKITGTVGSLLIIFIVFIGISLSFGDDKKEVQPKDAPSKLDASARDACEDFSRAISDVKVGILTDKEFRDKIQKVYDSAKLSSKGVKQPAQDLLRAVTSGTTEEAATAVKVLQEACKE